MCKTSLSVETLGSSLPCQDKEGMSLLRMALAVASAFRQRLSGMASYEHPLLSLRSSKNQCLILRHKHHTADLDLQVYFSSSPSFQHKPYNKCLREEPTSESKRAGRKFEFARGVEISPGPRSCWPLDWANDDRLTNPSPKFGCCLRSGKSSRVTTVGVCEGSASI